VKPLLAQPYVQRKLTFPCFVQPKLNGVRAVYQRGRFYSRDEHLWYPGVLSHLVEQLQPLLESNSIILDGELYCHGFSLQRINGAVAVKRTSPSTDTPFIQYHVFDCVKPGMPFSDRQYLIRELLGNGSECVRVVPTDLVYDQAQADAYFTSRSLAGYEGCMYRLGTCEYTMPGSGSTKDNRVQHMLKRKAWRDADFRVVGVQEGRETDLGGKYQGTLGAFILDVGNGRTFTAAPAFTDAERDHYFRLQPVGKWAVVKFLNLSDDGIPLHPIVLAIREA